MGGIPFFSVLFRAQFRFMGANVKTSEFIGDMLMKNAACLRLRKPNFIHVAGLLYDATSQSR